MIEVLAKKLTLEVKYCALRVSCEMGQPFGNEVGAAERTLLSETTTPKGYEVKLLRV